MFLELSQQNTNNCFLYSGKLTQSVFSVSAWLSVAALIRQLVRSYVHFSPVIYLCRGKMELNNMKEVAQCEKNLEIQSEQCHCWCSWDTKYELKKGNYMLIAYEEKHWVKSKATVKEVCNFSCNWLVQPLAQCLVSDYTTVVSLFKSEF